MQKTNGLLKNMAILTSGTAIAQGLTFGAAPLLSRLYSPDDFGIFSLYTSIIMVLSVLVSLRYEQAIVIAKKDEEAADILLISLVVISFNTLLIFLILFFFESFIIQLLGIRNFSNWLYLIPISVSAIGIYGSLNYWSTRKKSFKRLSISQIFRSIGLTGVQVGGGVTNQGAAGLIGGQLVGQILVSILLGVQVWKDDKEILIKHYSVSKMLKTAKAYIEFPLFSTPQGLLNSLSLNISPFFLVYYFGASIAGFYAIALKLIQLPIILIGNSIFQVFYPKITEEFNRNENIYLSFKKVVLFQFLIAVFPVFIIFFAGPNIFSIVLGEEWREAGVYARWLILWLFISFLCKPATAIIKLIKWQKYHMIFELFLLVSRIGILYFGGKYTSPVNTIILYSLIGALFELILLLLTLVKVKKISTKVN